MPKVEEIETIVLDALNFAVTNDFCLITGDSGVTWNAETCKWEPCTFGPNKACDLLASLALANSTLDREAHRGDLHRAARMALDPDYSVEVSEKDLDSLLESETYQICQSLVAGWDDEEDVFGNTEAFKLGQRLAVPYRPLSVEILELTKDSKDSIEFYPDSYEAPESERVPTNHVSGVQPIAELLEFTELETSLG